MKIKTIVHNDPAEFDTMVNQALGEGYNLGPREVISTPPAPMKVYHYAQLVLPDPLPEATDPVELLRQVKAFCLSQTTDDCRSNKCPLATLCDQLRDGSDPSEWELPENV